MITPHRFDPISGKPPLTRLRFRRLGKGYYTGSARQCQIQDLTIPQGGRWIIDIKHATLSRHLRIEYMYRGIQFDHGYRMP
jgi:hypothetical protein